MPHGAHLTAVVDEIGERKLGRWDKSRRAEPAGRSRAISRSRHPSRLERPNSGASDELGIKPNALDSWDAGEHLAADATGAEETKWRIAFRSLIRDTEGSDSSTGADERLRWLFLRDASVSTGFEKTPEWTARSRTRHRGVNGACGLETIAAIARALARLGAEVILHVPAQVMPNDAPGQELTGRRCRQQRRKTCRVAITKVSAE